MAAREPVSSVPDKRWEVVVQAAEALVAAAVAEDRLSGVKCERLISTEISRKGQLTVDEQTFLSDFKVVEYRTRIDVLISRYADLIGEVTGEVFDSKISGYVRAKFLEEAKELAQVFHATASEIEAFWKIVVPTSEMPLPDHWQGCSMDAISSPPGWAALLASIWGRVSSYIEEKHCELARCPVSATPAKTAERLGLAAAEVGVSKQDKQNKFFRSGDTWKTSFGEEEGQFPHRVGFDYIRVLMEHPGQPLDATQVRALCGPGAQVGRSLPLNKSDDLTVDISSSPQELSDSTARAQYRTRAREIADELSKARQKGEQVEVERLTKELREIVEHVQRETGLEKKQRRFPDENERARVAIRAAVRRAYDHMRKNACPRIVAYFEQVLRTGRSCIFNDTSASWVLREPSTKEQ